MVDPYAEAAARWHAGIDRLQAAVNAHDGEAPAAKHFGPALEVLGQLERRDQVQLAMWAIGLARLPLMDAGEIGELPLRWIDEIQRAHTQRVPEWRGPAFEDLTDEATADQTHPVRLMPFVVECYCRCSATSDPDERVVNVIAIVNLVCSILGNPLWWRSRGRRYLRKGERYLKTYYTSPQWLTCYRGVWTIVCQRLRMLMPPEPRSRDPLSS